MYKNGTHICILGLTNGAAESIAHDARSLTVVTLDAHMNSSLIEVHAHRLRFEDLAKASVEVV